MPNETITGKIYPVWNADKTERRFPQTVIEAVLGLPTYLQDQFSALADIYMPIEGITESKTGQEFVYRKSPATIKAKSLTLDRIKGKTLAWNQLLPKTAFSSNSWEGGALTLTNNGDGSYTINGTNANDRNATYSQSVIGGHKYLMLGANAAGTIILNTYTADVWGPSGKNAPVIITALASGNSNFRLYIYAGTYNNVKIWPMFIDLTLLFNGNVPENFTVADFEAMFPGYHDFGNKLISNDASALETTGFNQWDEEWEEGSYNSEGNKTDYTGRIRSKNFISVFGNTEYSFTNPDACWINEYDANKVFLERQYISGSQPTFTTGENTKYITFFCWSAGPRVPYQNDICINLSDPAKNGTYEPYRKTTLQLGLNNFKVKSHNIWDEEWELGSLSSGNNQTDSSKFRSKNYIPVVGGQKYYFKAPNSLFVHIYNAQKECISATSYPNGYVVVNANLTMPSDAAFIRFRILSGTTYNNDICINISSSFNGQYEPHGDIAITGGLKSAGSVRDEIVGNKYIKRVESVDLGSLTWTHLDSSNLWYRSIPTDSKVGPADSKVGNIICSTYESLAWRDLSTKLGIAIRANGNLGVTNGSSTITPSGMLYYELAIPIEYELVEPLIYTMAAGTTEARVSPNTDGLSAPFCCDMTYDANANNDSANAQYAATAGRLYNTHKLWGQDFDGSNDVSGALSGVTTIEASGNITTAAQLISTVATGTAPLSVASTTEVANLHSYTATKLHTQRTLWGQNFDGSGNVTGDMSSVGNIAFSASGKNIASLLYFDTTNSRLGVGAAPGAYKLDVNGTLNASGNTTLRGTLDVAGNTTIGGTFTVGTSSVNKATTLYGALTASGAVSFSDTLTIAGLTTFNGNAILPANKIFTIGPSSGTHATLEWDATNGCVKITGNLRVTGWIEQQGTQSNS